MVVCKYYLRGDCRYGDRCRFEHPKSQSVGGYAQGHGSFNQRTPQYSYSGHRANNNNYTAHIDPKPWALNQNQNEGNKGQSFGFSNRYAALSSQQTNDAVEPTPQEILESIKRDAEEWEASKMWPFSSYKATKAVLDVPEFEDLSPEELRFAAYTLEKEQNFNKYQTAVSAASTAIKDKWRQLKAPSHQLKSDLVEIYRGQHRSSTSIFGSTVPSITQALSQSFSANQSSSSSFTGGSSFTAGCNTAPALGGNPTPASGFFSAAATKSGTTTDTFQSKPPVGLFGKPQTSSTSLFGKAPDTNQGFFSKSQTPGFFSKTQDGSSQGQPSSQPTAGFFGKPASQPPTGLFGKPVSQPPTGLFGKPAPQQQSTGLFGKGVPSTGLFGKPAPSSGGSLSSSIYTPLNDLTEEEKVYFEAECFTLGKIPTRPPPRELVT